MSYSTGSMKYDTIYESTDNSVFKVAGIDLDKCKDSYPDTQ